MVVQLQLNSFDLEPHPVCGVKVAGATSHCRAILARRGDPSECFQQLGNELLTQRSRDYLSSPRSRSDPAGKCQRSVLVAVLAVAYCPAEY